MMTSFRSTEMMAELISDSYSNKLRHVDLSIISAKYFCCHVLFTECQYLPEYCFLLLTRAGNLGEVFIHDDGLNPLIYEVA